MFILSGKARQQERIQAEVARITQANAPKNPTVEPEDYSTPVSKGEYQNMLKTMYDNSKDPASKELLAREIRENRENGTSNGTKS